jgi:hypothetical protein
MSGIKKVGTKNLESHEGLDTAIYYLQSPLY